MPAIFFEILAVIFGTIAIFVPEELNPKIKFTRAEISMFAYLKNCGKIYKVAMFLCFLFNSIALYYYLGPIGLIFLISLLVIIISPRSKGSKIHLLCAFAAFLFYSLSSVIYNPWFLPNYLPIFGLIYAMITFYKNRSNSVGITFLVYSAAALMLINILLAKG